MDIFKSAGQKTHGSSDMGATTTIETETERDKDFTAIKKKKKEQEILAGDEAEQAEKIYKGMNGYTDWIEKKEQHGLAKGTGIRAGPIRTSLHIRQTVRFDYQPDVCKDYKETGYCGFGDSCKFMHDRTDYKSGWELEKEWEEQQRRKADGHKLDKEDEDLEIKPGDDLPFACSICRTAFVDPVVTKCKHYFCEKCALKRFKKDMKCFICGKNTEGSFAMADKKTRERLEQRRQKALENGENVQISDDEGDQRKEGEVLYEVQDGKLNPVSQTEKSGWTEDEMVFVPPSPPKFDNLDFRKPYIPRTQSTNIVPGNLTSIDRKN